MPGPIPGPGPMPQARCPRLTPNITVAARNAGNGGSEMRDEAMANVEQCNGLAVIMAWRRIAVLVWKRGPEAVNARRDPAGRIPDAKQVAARR